MEIVVASGKGGTGKTFISSNLVYYLYKHGASVVGVDADAEAPDLLLALGGSRRLLRNIVVENSRKARIIGEQCILCLKCLDVCGFNAIEYLGDRLNVVKEYCEGCGACSIVCPTQAIEFYVEKTGVVRVDETNVGAIVVTADLVVGGRNTGELVYRAKEEAHNLIQHDKGIVVVDAAAGIGCAVVSSIAGSNILVVVVEPTPASLQGAKRLLELAKHFNVKPYLILNKYDLDKEFSEKIANELGVRVLGRIPYSRSIARSYALMKPILMLDPSGDVSRALEDSFRRLVEEAGL